MSDVDTPGTAATLASWVVGFRPTPDDEALADRALLDTVAVGLAAHDHPLLDLTGPLGEAGRWAAACHVIDYDDLHLESTSHISTVCVPVALATHGGRAAYLAGAGVMARLGIALGWRHYSSGWHATCTTGALAAAVTAGVARGLDAEGLTRAMALAVPAAGGVQRAFGTDAKALQVGLAADAGVRAADLAAAGASADPAAVDDWLALLGGDRAALDLAGPAVPGGLAIKIYPACYALQRPIAALRQALDGATLDPATVRSVVVETPRATVQPLIHHQPRTGLQGKFSLEYAAATALLDDRHGFAEFTDAAVTRPGAQRLIGLVETRLEPDGEGLLAGAARVTVRTGSGRYQASLEQPPGAPGRPPTAEEHRAKVEDCLAATDVRSDAITWPDGAGLLRRSLTHPSTGTDPQEATP